MSDLGNVLLAEQLSKENMQKYYSQAIVELEKINFARQAAMTSLPMYDEKFIATELMIFQQWLLEEHLDIKLSAEETNKLLACFDYLSAAIIEQPKVFMHRDYHSRNIMLLENELLGIIDFQDAVHGPITYDLVSLLKDCYMAWPKDKVHAWVQTYYQQAREAKLVAVSLEQFMLWFDWMGMQRHLKAAGIFARLNHRDGKPGYMEDIPRTLNYIRDVTGQYQALQPFNNWFEMSLIPALEAKGMDMPEPLLAAELGSTEEEPKA